MWLDVLAQFGAEGRVVIPVRNPLEVAASLKRRNSFPPAKSYLLWLRHVLDAEKATRQLPRAIVNYSDLLNNWRRLVGRVTTETGVHWPRPSNYSEFEIDQFLTDTLRHHASDFTQLTDRTDVTVWVKEAYRLLLEMTGSHKAKDQFNQLDRIHSEFNKACTAFGLLAAEAEQSDSQLRSLETRVKTKDEEIVKLSEELTQVRNAAKESETKIAEIGDQLAMVKDTSEKLKYERDQLVAALEDEKAAMVRDNAQAVLLGQEIETLRAAVQKHETTATKLRVYLDTIQLLANGRNGKIDRLSGELIYGKAALRDRGLEID